MLGWVLGWVLGWGRLGGVDIGVVVAGLGGSGLGKDSMLQPLQVLFYGGGWARQLLVSIPTFQAIRTKP